MFDFATPINSISGIGKFYQSKFEKLGIKTVGDFLYYFPNRYEDYSNFKSIDELEYGEIATINGQITDIKTRRTWQKKLFITEAIVEDQTESIRAVWFNQPFLSQNLKIGDWVSLAGKISENDKGIYLSSPSYERISPEETDLRETGRLVPVYSETKGITSRAIRFFIKKILSQVRFTTDPLPLELRKKFGLPDLKTAIIKIHFPDSPEQAEASRKRFSFEELLLLELIIFEERKKITREKSFKIKANLEHIKTFVESLEFELTQAQRQAIFEILKDLGRPSPMNRLLEGDVGSGKTIVAAIATLATIKNNFQVALMAPTEILSHQHFLTFSKLFKNFGINIGLITSKESSISWSGLTSKTTKKSFLNACQNGELNLIIGTHSLVSAQNKASSAGQKNVKFKKLGLIIIDEQHRFGVQQRATLLKNNKISGSTPHLLSMTATPIPRTLALTIWGDLDISLINELPKNRKPIVTKLVAPENRQKAYAFIRQQIKLGRQAFVICPLIEKSQEKENNKIDFRKLLLIDQKSVTEEYERLRKTIFPDLKIGMLHGKMKSQEKEEIMKKFNDKEIDILVSTSVIEVGIDVPNATIMMIEGADRFGLAQLYQFRGRVGRGEHQSYCLLFSESQRKTTNQRLDAIIKAKNSFELAEKDLQIRGPGEFIGANQSGIPDYLMNALKNLELVKAVRYEAEEIFKKDPELKTLPLLKEKIDKNKQVIHLE